MRKFICCFSMLVLGCSPLPKHVFSADLETIETDWTITPSPVDMNIWARNNSAGRIAAVRKQSGRWAIDPIGLSEAQSVDSETIGVDLEKKEFSVLVRNKTSASPNRETGEYRKICIKKELIVFDSPDTNSDKGYRCSDANELIKYVQYTESALFLGRNSGSEIVDVAEAHRIILSIDDKTFPPLTVPSQKAARKAVRVSSSPKPERIRGYWKDGVGSPEEALDRIRDEARRAVQVCGWDSLRKTSVSSIVSQWDTLVYEGMSISDVGTARDRSFAGVSPPYTNLYRTFAPYYRRSLNWALVKQQYREHELFPRHGLNPEITPIAVLYAARSPCGFDHDVGEARWIEKRS